VVVHSRRSIRGFGWRGCWEIVDCSGAYPPDLVLADPKSRREKVGYVDDRLTEKDFVVGRTVTNGGIEICRIPRGCE
jgi:hypothetical protein